MTDTARYMDEVLSKFNSDPEDLSLTEAEKKLLTGAQTARDQIISLDTEVQDFNKKIKTLQEVANKEISEKQQKINELTKKILFLQGQAQGFIDSLLALR